MNPLRWPLWLRCQAIGLLWCGFAFAFIETSPRTVGLAIGNLVGGVVLGLVAWGLSRAYERRLFGVLTAAERAEVIEAVRTARPPEDPRLMDAAVRVARRQARLRDGRVFHAAFFGCFVALAVYLAVSVTPWFWFGVALFPLAGWYSWQSTRRERRAGEGFLRAAEAAAPSRDG
jgi:Flp pilus assembly protein TadB